MGTHDFITTTWTIIFLFAVCTILIQLFKRPKKNQPTDNAFDLVFKRQLELLKKIEERNTLQIDMFDSLNHNIMENYRILLQTQIKELIIHNPSDEDGIMRLYGDYCGIAKHPNENLDNIVTEWKKTRDIPLLRHRFKKFGKMMMGG